MLVVVLGIVVKILMYIMDIMMVKVYIRSGQWTWWAL